ncbi:MAG: outer membrane protein assembly factor BamA [Rhodospirillales bacterium]
MLRATTIALMMTLAGAAFVPAKAAQIQIAQSSGVIEEIAVEGTNRVDPETVKSYLLVKPGDTFESSRLDRSLKSLFATGLFADVVFRRQDGRLLISVVENPVINRVAFEGNDVLDDEELEPEITLRPRVIYTRTKVQNDVKRILTLYRRSGRFAASVEAKVIQLPQNRVDLVFEIYEGDPSAISNIRFIGNQQFDDDDLRDVVQTKETRWYRFLSSDDVYDPDRLTLDRELLRRFYLEEGYADFRVVSAVAELTPDRKDFFITFTVDEGERYQFGNIEIDARLKNLDPLALMETIEIQTGDWYDAAEVDEIIDDLSDQVGNLGYAFVDVRPRIQRNRAEHTIDVTFEVNEGPRVFVERIDIVGNVRTIDKVIRREFRMVEGDAFNTAKMRRSRQRVMNLGFFESVEIERLPGSDPDKTIIRTEVTEKSTGSLNLGFGFSSDIGPLADIGVSESNLLGAGYKLGLSARVAARRSDLDLSFTDPYFLDREFSAGFDLFRTTRDNQTESSFDSEEIGGRMRIAYPITEHLNQRWAYELSEKTVENVDDDASIFVQAQEGSNITSEISQTLTYDVRDSRIFPTEGYVVGISNDLAGLGGDTHYLRTELFGGHYWTVADDIVLNVSGEVGYIVALQDEVNLVDRFFVGGSNLRGFTPAGIGPRDSSTDDALGGEFKYTGTTQVSFPLGLASEFDVRGRVFSDFGSLGQLEPDDGTTQDTESLRVSTGVGVTYVSPFGPIGIDVSRAVVKESFDETETVRFNFGTQF